MNIFPSIIRLLFTNNYTNNKENVNIKFTQKFDIFHLLHLYINFITGAWHP